jgi:hypothetical protein
MTYLTDANHLTERVIVELRDNTPVVADARVHLDGCDICQTALAASEDRAADIVSTLTDLDEHFDVESAREAVRARLAQREPAAKPVSDRGLRTSFWTLGRAATFLLVTTGALSALPGSPLREFLIGREAQAPEPSALPPGESAAPVGMRMVVEGGAVDVELQQVPSGTSIEVRWLSGQAVTVLAATGSSFTSAQGLVRATITGGPVTIELPKSASEVSLAVNGRMYLRRTAGEETLSGPVDAQDVDRVLFIVP